MISSSLRALALALPLIAPSPGTGTSTDAGASPSVSVALEQCVAAVDQVDRSATFSGQMNAIAGAPRMAIRIEVQERAPGDTSFHTVAAPGLGVWRRSAPGVKIYKYLKQVTNLSAPASYRAIVYFRWMNTRGIVVKHSARHTAPCDQPDERPRLIVDQVSVAPFPGSSEADYRIVLRNEGHGPAGAFKVTLSVGGSPEANLEVPSLEAGAHAMLHAEALRCAPGSEVEVALDPEHRVEEAPGGGLSDTVPCPLMGGESA